MGGWVRGACGCEMGARGCGGARDAGVVSAEAGPQVERLRRPGR